MRIDKTVERKTNSPIWYFSNTDKNEKIDLLDNIRKFVEQHFEENYVLQVHDNISLKTIEIEVQPEKITQVIGILMDKNGTVPTYVGVNRNTKSYVVEMPITSKFTKHKHYRFANTGLEYI